MKTLLRSVSNFIHDESGPAAVEYCFMIGFILLVCIAAIGDLGQATHDYYLRTLAVMP
jgi:Flp pilus assembly pilin Flp